MFARYLIFAFAILFSALRAGQRTHDKLFA